MLKNILIATDFSAASKAALRIAIKLCKSSRAQLHVVHVLPKMDGRVFKVLSHLAEKDMQKFFPTRLYPRNRKEVLFNDSPSEAILKYAKKRRCGLIVLGSKNRTRIGAFLAGSVITPLSQKSTIPLMLVSVDGKKPAIQSVLGILDNVIVLRSHRPKALVASGIGTTPGKLRSHQGKGQVVII